MWNRRRREVAKAHQQVRVADREVEHADERAQKADRVIAESKESLAVLRHEIEINGWTEMLQRAWGRG